jgi:hypothetical protein
MRYLHALSPPLIHRNLKSPNLPLIHRNLKSPNLLVEPAGAVKVAASAGASGTAGVPNNPHWLAQRCWSMGGSRRPAIYSLFA